MKEQKRISLIILSTQGGAHDSNFAKSWAPVSTQQLLIGFIY